MNLDEILNYRRSVRVYDKGKPIDTERVKHCLELATLAPNSSDMGVLSYHRTRNVGESIQSLPRTESSYHSFTNCHFHCSVGLVQKTCTVRIRF